MKYSNYFTDPPENVQVNFTRNGTSVNITCDADGYPPPTFKIYFNETFVASGKTHIVRKINSSYVGYYKCVAENMLGNSSSVKYLPLKGKIT